MPHKIITNTLDEMDHGVLLTILLIAQMIMKNMFENLVSGSRVMDNIFESMEQI